MRKRTDYRYKSKKKKKELEEPYGRRERDRKRDNTIQEKGEGGDSISKKIKYRRERE